jgi:hypothetical protein
MYIFNQGAVIKPSNPEFYCKVNPLAFPVKKTKGGWVPVNSFNSSMY